MRRFDKRIFDPQKRIILVQYRLLGYSISTLAYIFKADRSSVRYQLHKAQVPQPEEVYTLERIIAPIIQEYLPSLNEWDVIEGVRVNAGKDYADYLSPLKIKVKLV